MTGTLSILLVSPIVAGLAVVVAFGPEPRAGRARHSVEPGAARRLAIAIAVAGVVFVASAWVLPAAVVGGAAWVLMGSGHGRASARDDVQRTEAIASWIENLRDVLMAGEQPVGAISATVRSAHPIIRPHVRRLAAGLAHHAPDVALRRFADDVDDPLGDLVAAGLLIAIRRGARTVAVLTALAAQARQRADRRRIVDAERAPVQREVTMLTITMAGLLLALFVFGRAEYLAPYSSSGGQAFLAVVVALYAALLVRVQRLGRRPRPSRFIGTAVDSPGPAVGSL